MTDLKLYDITWVGTAEHHVYIEAENKEDALKKAFEDTAHLEEAEIEVTWDVLHIDVADLSKIL